MPYAVEELMRERGSTGETRFRRQTLSELLTPTGETGALALSASEDPSEA